MGRTPNQRSSRTPTAGTRQAVPRGSTQSGEPSLPRLRKHWLALGAAGVLLVVLIVHWPALHAGALSFDDSEYLTENVLVQNPSPATAWRFLREVLEPSTVHGYYQPLTMISLMIDYALGGRPDHLLAFHRTSLILHLANTLLIMLIVWVLFRHALAAGLVGLLFGVHPMTVETIAWVGERKTLLAAFFAFLSVLSYVHYAAHGKRLAYAASAVTFALALLAKPTVTPLPVCLLLMDVWPLNRLSRRAVLEKLPFLFIALISACVTFESQRRTAVAVLPGQDYSVPVHYVIAHNIVFYPCKMIWPADLSSHYAYPSPLNLSHPAIAAGVAGTIALLIAVAVSLRWTRVFVAGWLWFFVALFPTLGVIGFTNVIASDKYAYWPVLGLLLALAWVIRRALPADPGERLGVGSKALVAVCLFAALGFSVATRNYLQQWRTTESLFRYMVSLNDRAAGPILYLGLELDRQGRTAEAVEYHRRSVALAPLYEDAHYNLGNALHKLQDHDGAVAAFEQAIRLKPDFAAAFNNLGNALLARGDRDRARAAYLQALALEPDKADAHYNLANLLVAEQDMERAVEHYETAIRLQPVHAAAHKNLAGTLWEMGRYADAVRRYEQALQLQPAYWDVAVHLANVLAESSDPSLRRPDVAVQYARHAVEVTTGRSAAALTALAVACEAAGRLDEAGSAARQALRVALANRDRDQLRVIQQRLARYLPAAPSHNPSGP